MSASFLPRGFSVPELSSLRGAGLGNEAFAWAKALIGAYELGLVPLHPAWFLNPRGYRRDFGTSRLDWLAQRALRAALPELRVTADDLGPGTDYAVLMRELEPELGRRRAPVMVVHASGMAGGYATIAPAREALRTLLLAPRHVARDIYEVERSSNPSNVRVGVHVRAGTGFHDGPPAPGEFNKRLPVSWYASVVDVIADALGAGRLEVALVGDEIPMELRDRVVAKGCTIVTPPPRRRPLLSDLHLLASSDVLVCSVSSFSLLAAFLGEQPYIWYSPQLTDLPSGRAIWPDDVPPGARPTRLPPRGVPLTEAEPIPDQLVEALEARLQARDRRRDLIYGGLVP